VTAFVTPILLTFLFNLFRLAWIYLRTQQNTWQAPAGLEALLKGSSTTAQVRLWPSSRAFAFNLPRLWPGSKSRVILSTGMVASLDEEELRAVLWHETAHLAHRDFWIVWLVSWWRLAFFYLPVSGRLFNLLKEDQELACDERVARQGGQSLALALADALLKVWEQTLVMTNTSKSIGFRAPGLASQNRGEVELTEQRVNRLLDWGKVQINLKSTLSVQTRLRTLGFLSSSIGMWLFILELIHLIMLPMGCTITLELF
jgi:hypothetical protein